MKLNKKNHDGSINSYQETKQRGHGHYVMITHSKFRSQIEDGIWDVVNILIKKGYSTYTSCEGHGLYNYYFKNGIRKNSGPQVSVAFESEKDANFFKQLVSSTLIKGKRNRSIKSKFAISVRCRFTIFPICLQRILLKRKIQEI